MEERITADKTVTFYNEKFGEHYHSQWGAREDAIKKYVEPALQELQQDKVIILDVCFGLGYNSAAALELVNKNTKVIVIGLENDQAILNKIQEIDFPFSNKELFVEVAKNKHAKKDNVTVKLFLGDALETIKEVKEQIDVVFFDAFSPKKCPALWTTNFFKDIFNIMNTESILTTYSCARQIRENMKEAGFIVSDGPVYGRRAPGTIARKPTTL